MWRTLTSALNFALVLKGLTISNGRFAADLAVDKSLVGRWIAGTVTPSAYNRERLTRLIAERLPGFSLLDWDRPLADLAGVVDRRGGVPGRGGDPPAPPPADAPARPSIAVLPFSLVGIGGPHAVIAEALPHDLIADLSRLRWLFVIARGSSFRLRAADPDVADVGRILGVRYCLTGTVEVAGDRIAVSVELSATRDAGVIWSERFATTADGVHDLRARIAASVITALEFRIPAHEARTARLTDIDNLDAWSSYHLGLQHMYRFTRADNATAMQLFDRAITADPAFVRAHCGLSFTHFQNAFHQYDPDVAGAVAAAERHASRAIELDDADPFANLVMGRSYWIAGDPAASLGWLDRAIDLNPNYAQAIYARGYASTMLCRGDAGQTNVDEAMALSPIDPMHYAMLGTRALAHSVRGEDGAAAAWAERAAHAPGAHALIAVIAAACHALDGDAARAAAWLADAQRRAPVSRAIFFRSFPLVDTPARRRIDDALVATGL